jgi:hypothetical protein
VVGGILTQRAEEDNVQGRAGHGNAQEIDHCQDDKQHADDEEFADAQRDAEEDRQRPVRAGADDAVSGRRLVVTPYGLDACRRP